MTFVLFFLSGAFALVYQVGWVRAITLEFGSTTLAVATVLTVFMGGLALGSWWAGARADASHRPLTTYGGLELGLGLYTALTPLLFGLALPWFSRLAYGFADSLLAISLLRFAATTLLLLAPTVLMGATLPVLSRFWALRKRDSGRWAGLLYGVNTLGAFVGTLAAGFWLLPTLGLSTMLYLVAALNVLLAVVALWAGSRLEGGVGPGVAVTDPDARPGDHGSTSETAEPQEVREMRDATEGGASGPGLSDDTRRISGATEGGISGPALSDDTRRMRRAKEGGIPESALSDDAGGMGGATEGGIPGPSAGPGPARRGSAGGGAAGPGSASAPGGHSHWAMYAAVALTGFAALACEVAWTRALVLVLGASVYAFSIVLATFLAGLGAGSAAVAAALRARPERARVVFYGLALAAAAAVCVTSATFRHLPPVFVALYDAWQVSADVDRVLLIQALLSGAVMVVPSFIMGGLFPTALRVLVHDPANTGARVGRLYAWNTVGCIAGSFAAGFVMIPVLGIRGALLAAATTQVAGAGAAIAGLETRRRVPVYAGGAAVVLALLLLSTPPWHHQLMASAAYHYAGSYGSTTADELSREIRAREELLFYRDGLTATVTVSRDLQSPNHDLYISTNGKIDGSSHYDMPTQRLSAHLPLLLHPDPQQVAVIGMGTGCTAGSAGLHPVRGVTLVELEEAMVEGARFFREHNHAVHENPRVSIRVTDGRLFLNHRPAAFDVVVSEPSNPWLAGTSDLFTREFFGLGARALREGGIFAQWLQLYGMRPENVRTIIRTFADVFPFVYLASTIPDTDVLLLGSSRPIEPDIERIRAGMERPEIAADLADPRVGIGTAYELLARIRMGPEEVGRFAGSGPLHTDDLPVIAYEAPRDLYRDTRRANMRELARHARGIGPYLAPEDDRSAVTVTPTDLRALAQAYEDFLPGGAEAQTARQLLDRTAEGPARREGVVAGGG